MKKTVALYNTLRPYMLGDFYPLFPHSAAEDVWYGYQFNRPDQVDGMIQLFRREKNGDTTKTVRLRSLDPTTYYEVTDHDTGTTTAASGKELIERGLTVEINAQPGAVVLLYKQAARADR